jgi:flavodoxin
MKIGLIIYSQTGNTLSVARKIEEKLIAANQTATLEKIKIEGDAKPGDKNIKFESIPDTTQYDAIIFGSPVQAFSLSAPMSAYLSQLKSLQGKKIALLVTQHFPFPWMGGNRAVRQMKKLCESKGAEISGSGIVNWHKASRQQLIDEVVDRLYRLFT